MIICICNAIGDKHLDNALAQGASNVCDAFQKIGCQPMCGKCIPDMHDAIESRAGLHVSK